MKKHCEISGLCSINLPVFIPRSCLCCQTAVIERIRSLSHSLLPNQWLSSQTADLVVPLRPKAPASGELSYHDNKNRWLFFCESRCVEGRPVSRLGKLLRTAVGQSVWVGRQAACHCTELRMGPLEGGTGHTDSTHCLQVLMASHHMECGDRGWTRARYGVGKRKNNPYWWARWRQM